ncbi:thiolase family protein [Devosia honganensis]|uniref:Thiolase family protein n=1 Tax=Devosia honganensis TaxID=1610527 RepID=A0ABV7WZJ9_9HYPH
MIGSRRKAAIIGIGETDYVGDWKKVRAGERVTDAYGYGARAFKAALADAGIARDRIDGVIVGQSTAYERMCETVGLNVRWGGRQDAGLAVIEACMAIETGAANVVALIYGNDQRSASTQYGGTQAMGGDLFLSYVYHTPWGLTSQGALYALMMNSYSAQTGFDRADLGYIGVAQRQFASLNEQAIMRKVITHDDYLASPYICEPLRLLDYCLVNDGGVALILAEAGLARALSNRPVYVEALGRYDLNRGATSLEPRFDDFYHPAHAVVREQVFGDAGLDLADIDSFQVYDSFSAHVPLALEGYGYCAVGDVGRFLREDGIGPGGVLPTNTSGGHLSESYMQGWNHQVEAIRQLRGTCGARQVEDCRRVHYSADIAGKAISIIYGTD